jgi:hypothetical protein
MSPHLPIIDDKVIDRVTTHTCHKMVSDTAHSGMRTDKSESRSQLIYECVGGLFAVASDVEPNLVKVALCGASDMQPLHLAP